MTLLVAALNLFVATSQDPAPAQPPPRIGFASNAAPGQDSACDGKCHEGQVCAQFARICNDCQSNVTPCGPHAQLCQTCADKKKVCPFCGKPKGTPTSAAAARIAKELSAALPGHRPGREMPNKLAAKLLPRVKFFYVFHSASPCKECAENAEVTAAVEYKDDKDKEGTAVILRSEKDLAGLLKRQKLAGGAEGALLAAQLVQSLWRPIHGGLDPSDVEKVKLEGGAASFEYKKGHAYWSLTLRFDKDGAFETLEVKDTGRMCR